MLELDHAPAAPAHARQLRYPDHATLVLLPTYNERENLAPLVAAVRRHLPKATIWVIDDNSPDGTGWIADQLATRDPRIEVIHRRDKLGLGTAYAGAFRRALRADFEYVIQMDVDFSHDPRYLPALITAARDSDVVVGSRYVAGGGTANWPWTRRVISRVGNGIARRGLGMQTHDTTGGFRLYRRSALGQLDLDSLDLRGYGFMIEVLFQLERGQQRVREVPIIFEERTAGASKMSRAIAQEALLHIARRRLDLLLRPFFGPTRRRHQPSSGVPASSVEVQSQESYS